MHSGDSESSIVLKGAQRVGDEIYFRQSKGTTENLGCCQVNSSICCSSCMLDED